MTLYWIISIVLAAFAVGYADDTIRRSGKGENLNPPVLGVMFFLLALCPAFSLISIVLCWSDRG